MRPADVTPRCTPIIAVGSPLTWDADLYVTIFYPADETLDTIIATGIRRAVTFAPMIDLHTCGPRMLGAN
jgi:hypothetical protein